jgi:hypothetical protein
VLLNTTTYSLLDLLLKAGHLHPQEVFNQERYSPEKLTLFPKTRKGVISHEVGAEVGSNIHEYGSWYPSDSESRRGHPGNPYLGSNVACNNLTTVGQHRTTQCGKDPELLAVLCDEMFELKARCKR